MSKNVNVYLKQKAGCYGVKYNQGEGKIIDTLYFETIEEEVCELILVEQNEKYYLFGATPNSNWFGFRCEKDTYDKWENKFKYFNNLWI